MLDTLLPWVLFNALILALLAVDLGVFHRKAHTVGLREAAAWSAVWIALALVFNAGVFYFGGSQKGTEFLTGYLIEKSLSVDNVFVFVLLFTYFAVPAQYQHRVLFWGILGALVMRGAMIIAGAALLEAFHWIIYIFGAVIIVSGIKMLRQGHEELHPERNPVVRLVRRFFPVAAEYHGQRFFVRTGGTLMLTPLAIVLIIVETTDLIFALDSIPAIFAITRDPFIVYTSNVFAILGLRALYFLLAGVVRQFVYLKAGLSAILIWVGAKMLLTDVYEIPTLVSLGVVAAILAVAIAASVLRTAVLKDRVPTGPSPPTD
ncbi:MAG: TerC family protein [Dehalococcoidia bacterium]|nr:TerC family protein [Dehalococcoidia bacterium]